MPPTHTPTIHPMSIKGISMFLYRKQFFAILHFHFSWLNWVRKCCIFFLLYIRAPLSVPLTMHIVNSINSICLHFNRSDSFIQWNQTDPAALSILTHLVPLVPSHQLIWLKQTWNLSKNLHDPIFGRKNFTHWERVNQDYFRQQ